MRKLSLGNAGVEKKYDPQAEQTVFTRKVWEKEGSFHSTCIKYSKKTRLDELQ